MIHFDAHADTGDIKFGSLIGHGQPMRRLIESGAVRGDRFLQIGLRGYWPGAGDAGLDGRPADAVLRDDRDRRPRPHRMPDRGVRASPPTTATACSCRWTSTSATPAMRRAPAPPSPAGCPPGNCSTRSGGSPTSCRWSAMDVVEVSPPYDHADITAVPGQPGGAGSALRDRPPPQGRPRRHHLGSAPAPARRPLTPTFHRSERHFRTHLACEGAVRLRSSGGAGRGSAWRFRGREPGWPSGRRSGPPAGRSWPTSSGRWRGPPRRRSAAPRCCRWGSTARSSARPSPTFQTRTRTVVGASPAPGRAPATAPRPRASGRGPRRRPVPSRCAGQCTSTAPLGETLTRPAYSPATSAPTATQVGGAVGDGVEAEPRREVRGGGRDAGEGGGRRTPDGTVCTPVPPLTAYRAAVPATVQAPPVSALPQPFAVVRAKASAAAPSPAAAPPSRSPASSCSRWRRRRP